MAADDTCWILNRAMRTCFVQEPIDDDPDRPFRPHKLAPGDQVQVQGLVADWKRELRDFPHLEVRTNAAPSGETMEAVKVVTKSGMSKAATRRTNRRTKDEIEAAT